MRNLTLLTLLLLAVAVPLQADDESRHQSYISFDDGGTLLKPSDDDREIEGRVNLPIFPGDEVITNRRGRTEVRLADGNVVGIDRATAVRFLSILDSYEGDASETIAELRYGKVAVYRIDGTRDYFRLDTPSASYFASDEAIFSVETDSRGRDRVAVLDGVIEVRTPERSTRLREGEQAEVDDRGLFETAGYARHSADDFESWFLRRTQRYDDRDSRYLDRSLAYYDDELSGHGSWVHINSYGWAWRPTVGAGWRPYYNGYWMRGRSGCMTWVSYEPWGWVPYHYGRWSHDPLYGWFWLPGTGYAPAWVYWWYGNGYLGWAPSGYWDAYRPYHHWNYRPYHRAGLSFGFGFYGRIRVNDVDLRPWTFIDANTIVSNRVDRAALTTDAIRARLQRDRDGFATVSSDPARFTREEFRDPAAAINRRWTGADTGRETAGPVADLTPYIRRDDNVSGAIRDRVTRNRPSTGATTPARAAVGGGSGSPALGGGNLGGVHRGNSAAGAGRDRINRGGQTRVTEPSSGGVVRGTPGPTNRGDTAGRVRRGDDGNRRDLTPDSPQRQTVTPEREAPVWRDRISRPAAPAPRQSEPATRTPESTPDAGQAWRGRVSRPSDGGTPEVRRPSTATPRGESGAREVPRRVIDRIGGARVQSGSRSTASRPSRSSEPSQPRSVNRGSSGSGRSSGSVPRTSGSSRGESRPSSSSGSTPSRSSGSRGESRSSDDGGRIKRDQ